ncbi:MAG TPA: ChbG/HpnK family deacetylase [Acidimicrobiales bacterium]|nr:ChbG/HpnK family deacetylase [Acidimicrobiales bacterium]
MTTEPGRPDRRVLIVHADDYGLTEAVSAGILRGHEDGIITSTSVLTLAPAFASTAPRLAASPIDVGVHLAAVGEDPPMLSAREIPTLVDRRGRLPLSWKVLLPRLAARRVDPADVAREFAAQVEAAVTATGRRPTHLDTHQHLHLWPSIATVVVDLARREAIAAIRVPRSHRPGIGTGVRRLSRRLEKAARGAGLQVPDDSTGLDEAGRVDGAALQAAVDGFARRGARVAELGCHPGEHDDPHRHRYAWGYTWGAELDTLTAPESRRIVAAAGFELGGYEVLVAP